MKIAIIYYSMSGNSQYTAMEIAKEVDCDLIPIQPIKEYPSKGVGKFIWGGKSAVMGETPKLMPYEFDADKYEHIIIGTPVWASNITPPIRSFIRENDLAGKKVSAFLCFSGGGADKAMARLQAELKNAKWCNELILIDPKEKQSEENGKKIKKFANSCR